ncbi:YceI family protein [Myroides sp. LJL119]
MESNLIWDFDPTHSQVIFTVKHMVFTTITGRFDQFTAQMQNNTQDFTTAKLGFTAQVSSINTNNKDRDNHLLSQDFFDAQKYPTIDFQSTHISKTQDGHYQVSGQLTMLDKSISITLQAQVSSVMVDPWGNNKIAISLNGKINRKDFGLSYNAVLEKGGLLIAEEIGVHAEVQFVENKA